MTLHRHLKFESFLNILPVLSVGVIITSYRTGGLIMKKAVVLLIVLFILITKLTNLIQKPCDYSERSFSRTFFINILMRSIEDYSTVSISIDDFGIDVYYIGLDTLGNYVELTYKGRMNNSVTAITGEFKEFMENKEEATEHTDNERNSTFELTLFE